MSKEGLDSIRILNRPSKLEQIVYIFFRLFFLIIIILIGWFIDNYLLERFSDVVLLPVIFILLLFSLLIVSRMRTIFKDNQFLRGTNESLVIESKRGVIAKYSWEDISKILITYEGVKLYLILINSNNSEEKLELCEKWIYSEIINSKKNARNNYEKLMKVFSGNIYFLDRFDEDYKMDFIKEFSAHR